MSTEGIEPSKLTLRTVKMLFATGRVATKEKVAREKTQAASDKLVNRQRLFPGPRD